MTSGNTEHEQATNVPARADILYDLGDARLTWLAQTTPQLKRAASHDIDDLLDELISHRLAHGLVAEHIQASTNVH